MPPTQIDPAPVLVPRVVADLQGRPDHRYSHEQLTEIAAGAIQDLRNSTGRADLQHLATRLAAVRMDTGVRYEFAPVAWLTATGLGS